MIEIKDLSGLGQPISKLIEVVSSGMGALYKPYGIRREAAAQADAILKIGNAQTEIEIEKSKSLAVLNTSHQVLQTLQAESLAGRAEQRIAYQESKRQDESPRVSRRPVGLSQADVTA